MTNVCAACGIYLGNGNGAWSAVRLCMDCLNINENLLRQNDVYLYPGDPFPRKHGTGWSGEEHVQALMPILNQMKTRQD